MSTHSKTDPLHPLAREGIQLIDQGKYYEAHDLLEEAWMVTVSPERDLYQGILQVGLAYYQITRGNYRGGLKMFRQARHNLATLGKSQGGIDLDQLREDAQVVELELRRLGPDKIGDLDPILFKPVPFNS